MSRERLQAAEMPVLPERQFNWAAGIRNYINEAEQESILRPDQQTMFGAIERFLGDKGPSWGYVQSPTGTGKTVVFVELSKALQHAKTPNGETPRILVVTPKKDLVHQTVGKSGKKGYGKFAPDLTVASYFSDSSEHDRKIIQDADVVVTTYDSMNLMDKRNQFAERSPSDLLRFTDEQLKEFLELHGNSLTYGMKGELRESLDGWLKLAEELLFSADLRHEQTDASLLDYFDAFILDEAHHALGDTAGTLLDKIPSHKPVIGFTATPDANQKRKLSQRLPRKIYQLPFNQALDMGLLAPLVPLGLKSNVRLGEQDIFDAEGEYLDERISHLARSAVRNSVIVSAAKVLADNKIGTIVSCLAGDEALHSRILAQQMRDAGIKAKAVYGGVTSRERQRIYEQFEKGDIDVLTFVEVLGEGWDSDRAKAIINGRPTRSLIIAQQRLGRPVRLGDLAYSIDIIDEYDDSNPPLHASDLINQKDVPRGKYFGELTDKQIAAKDNIIASLGKVARVLPILPADYSMSHARIHDYVPIKGGSLSTNTGKQYSTSHNIGRTRGFIGLDDEILDKLWRESGEHPDILEGAAGFTIRRAYEREATDKLIISIPENDPQKVLVETNGSRWMSPEGIMKLFSKRFPNIDEKSVHRAVYELGDQMEWKPLAHTLKSGARRGRTIVYKAFRMDNTSVELLNGELKRYFDLLESLDS